MDKKTLIKDLEEKAGKKEGTESNYVLEVRDTVKNECWRSSIVLGWGMFMEALYSQVESYSFEAFAEKAKERNIEVGTINRKNDLTEIKDYEVLITAKELSILPPQLEDQLRTIQLRKRNNCAHFGSHSPSENSVFEFFSEIFAAIDELKGQEFENRETEFLTQIKNMPPNKIENLETDGERAKNALRQIQEELLFIETEKDYETHKNYIKYIETSATTTSEREIIEQCLNCVLEILESDVFYQLKRDVDDILKKILRRKEGKKLVSTNQKYKQKIITGFSESGSYRQAERRLKWLTKIERFLDEDDWSLIAQATAQNNQIYMASGCRRRLPQKLREHSEAISQGTIDDLEERGEYWQDLN